jgi:N-acetylglutamate synthase-like GNAT family acetyltransferase
MEIKIVPYLSPCYNSLTSETISDQRFISKMAQNIHLRKIKKADLPSVYELVRNTIQVSYADVYPLEAIEFFKNYHNRENILKDVASGYTIVAESEGLILGTGTLLEMNVRRVYIDPQHQHRGIGQLIVKKLEQKAKSERLEKLDLSASLKSRRFWEAMGFVFVAEYFIPVANDKKLIYYEMAKTLK